MPKWSDSVTEQQRTEAKDGVVQILREHKVFDQYVAYCKQRAIVPPSDEEAFIKQEAVRIVEAYIEAMQKAVDELEAVAKSAPLFDGVKI
jgi:hypothetical protein